MSPHSTGSILALLAVFSLPTACETPPAPDDGVTAAQFSDIPVPDGMWLNEQNHVSDAVVMGEYRHANFQYRGQIAVAEVTGYLRLRMPQHRWELIGEETEKSGDEVLRFRRGKYVAECYVAKLQAYTEMNISVRTSLNRSNGQ